MGAPKIEKYPIQILSLTQIRVDHSIQSRVETSMEYQREFSEAMLRGDTFPPITVFFDGKVYWLADGFHRYGATKQASRMDPKLSGIRAEIRNGTRRDAVVFSAGANQKFSIPRTKEDVKKAVWMLLDDEEWRGKADTMIAKHCGTANSTIAKFRLEHSHSRGIPLPESVERSDGKIVSRRSPGRTRIIKDRNGGLRAQVNGKYAYLGRDPVQADTKVDGLLDTKSSRKRSLLIATLRDFLMRRGLLFAAHDFDVGGRTNGLTGVSRGHGVVMVSEEFDRQQSGHLSTAVPTAVGRILLARQLVDPSARAVVVCYVEDAPPELIAAGQAIGIEFLTPDELVSSLKGDTPA